MQDILEGVDVNMQDELRSRAKGGNRLDGPLSALIIGLPLLLATLCLGLTMWLKPYEFHSGDEFLDWYVAYVNDSTQETLRGVSLGYDSYWNLTGWLDDVDGAFAAVEDRFGDDPRFWLEWYRLRVLKLDSAADSYAADKLAALEVLEKVAGQPADSGQAALERLLVRTESLLGHEDIPGNRRLNLCWEDADFASGLAQVSLAPHQDWISHMMLASAWIADGRFPEARREALAMSGVDSTATRSVYCDIRRQMFAQGREARGPSHTVWLLDNSFFLNIGFFSFIEMKGQIQELGTAAFEYGDMEMLDALQDGISAGFTDGYDVLNYLVGHVMLGKLYNAVRDNSDDPAELARMEEIFRRKKVHSTGIKSINSSGPVWQQSGVQIVFNAAEGALSGGRASQLNESLRYYGDERNDYEQLKLLQQVWDDFTAYSFVDAAFPDGWQASERDEQLALQEQQSRAPGILERRARQQAIDNARRQKQLVDRLLQDGSAS
jgi:hypothetical protein